ncbi:MAG: hypothetical protein JJW00_02850 [Sulfurimonas sp.]|nr:hypothetical protein [Sulfurimonas sp.]
MRNAFSFVEVIVSIAILSYMGLALLKFNAFNRHAMERNIIKQKNILLTSSILFEKDMDKHDKGTLFELTTFVKLHDDDTAFLKSIKLESVKTLDDKLILGNTGKEEFSMEYGMISVVYEDSKQNYLWVQKGK